MGASIKVAIGSLPIAGLKALTSVVLIICLLSIAGCKAVLYSSLTEVEANQMMAALMSNGIIADKVVVGDTFSLKIEQSDMVRAIDVLDAKGYPKTLRQSMGTVFGKSGIISSPFEERIRYIYALGQEVEKTLSQIDGVVAARVHIVLPEEPKLGQPAKPSSAAVFIKHEPSVDMEFLVPQIRRLVSSAIEGLDYEAVTVVLTEALATSVASQAPEQIIINVLPGLGVRAVDVERFWYIAYGVLAIVGLLFITSVAGGLYFFTRRRGPRRGAIVPHSATDTALEPS